MLGFITMTNTEAIIELIEKWYSTKSWAELLICKSLNIESASDILQQEYRGKKKLGDSDWYYRTHGVGVDIAKVGNKGGIDFDFDKKHPDNYRLREFMIKQLNDGKLVKKHYRELLQDEQLWRESYEAAKKT